MQNRLFKFAAISTILVALAACSESQGQDGAAAPQMPPSKVSVVEVTAEPLPITNELPGRVAPTRIAEVRPRVSGIIVERVFEQGSQVQAGDVLYRIDPKPFEVQVASAEATLKRAHAVQSAARQVADRQTELAERRVTSTQTRDDAVAALAQADADVAIAEAGVASAQLNLEYASVRAPIAGVIGRAMITEGALVSSAESLATIQQLDPVYIDFTQSSTELIRLRQALAAGQLESPAPGEAAVRMLLDDGSEYPHKGSLLFSEATVDQTTGQVTLRAELPNPDGDLLPGMYARVLIEQGIERSAFAVPQQAVQRDAGGQSSVLVVAAENKVEQRRITVGRTLGNRFIISQGLKAGDRVVAEGFQKTAAGATVDPQPWSPQDAQPNQPVDAPVEDQAGNGDATGTVAPAGGGEQAPAAKTQTQ